MTLTINQVNYLNIALMAASCLFAFLFPFELFLLSYAVLGPLHYLTEISWLHDRKYFLGTESGKKTKRLQRRWLILVVVTMAVLMAGFIAVEGAGAKISPKWEITLFYLVFATALLITEVKSRFAKMIGLAGALSLLALLSASRYYIVVAFFLITIIHVLIFTGAFILYGALKGRSLSGVLSLMVFVLCAASFFLYVPTGYAPGSYVQQSYSSFNALNAELIKLFGLGLGTSANELYGSQSGLVVMRLIAFAYTYHYLNWFSKTSIIKWHEVSRKRVVLLVMIWLGALGIYAWDYGNGMAVLYFLSVLHVMLEFPLNHRTFVGIGRELLAMRRLANLLRGPAFGR